MKRVFAILVVLVLCIVAIGFYRNWIAVTSPSSDTKSNKVNVGVTLDPDKVNADAELVMEKAAALTDQAKEEANELGDQESDKVKSHDD